MHDIGKVGISDTILLKPGKLTDDEFGIMKSHTTMGRDMLSSSDMPLLKASAQIALTHHEKWDGSGYPLGLSGTDIHIFGRIVMIADIFDALISERPYKKAFSLEKALEIMKEGKGEFFDPTLLELFLDNLDVFLGIMEEFKDKNEPADSERNEFPAPHYLNEFPAV